ncbi:hypothetical protein NOV78_11930 [Klebsiella pneumoniae]|uniref:hypothetical protein n=1 Tax=Klebsiella pneumoniae TaxID=573 RepID=UPI000B9B2C24|nr:hypothetical protein [Klebsiella pneumoniae]HDT1329927.1 hypothetical protein [Klebsiella pneumoniae subsp. pneumoniae]AVW78053.1 hypothetical protein B7D34_22410 [Klebsiella pneumoniae]MCM6710548.1 hypothetical protein [Klebsiella pneumoniae]MCX0260239.1 hypothetical protein [Klebsiella pneumoniae]MCX0282249.1 hypothetical protein [Klebsiella pneumoniae]
MNIDTVNELIQSLESAGELSIKERKYLDLAKAYADKESESVAQALTFEKCRELSGCPAGVDLQDWVKQLAAENVGLKNVFSQKEIPSEAVDAFMETAVMDHDWNETSEWSWVENETEVIHAVLDALKPDTPATDRIVAGIKADGAAEREKTITFTAAKKRTQDGVALIAIGKPYKIHNDDVIGEFFIGERGRYGVITMDRLDYFTTSEEYAWEFTLREGADK